MLRISDSRGGNSSLLEWSVGNRQQQQHQQQQYQKQQQQLLKLVALSFPLHTHSHTHSHTPTSNKRLAERKSFVDTCRGCCSTTKASRSANRHNLPMPCPILIATFALPMHIQFYALPCDNMGHPHRSYPPSPSHR